MGVKWCRQDAQEGYLHREGKELGLAKVQGTVTPYTTGRKTECAGYGSGNWVVWVVGIYENSHLNLLILSKPRESAEGEGGEAKLKVQKERKRQKIIIEGSEGMMEREKEG